MGSNEFITTYYFPPQLGDDSGGLLRDESLHIQVKQRITLELASDLKRVRTEWSSVIFHDSAVDLCYTQLIMIAA